MFLYIYQHFHNLALQTSGKILLAMWKWVQHILSKSALLADLHNSFSESGTKQTQMEHLNN